MLNALHKISNPVIHTYIFQTIPDIFRINPSIWTPSFPFSISFEFETGAIPTCVTCISSQPLEPVFLVNWLKGPPQRSPCSTSANPDVPVARFERRRIAKNWKVGEVECEGLLTVAAATTAGVSSAINPTPASLPVTTSPLAETLNPSPR